MAPGFIRLTTLQPIALRAGDALEISPSGLVRVLRDDDAPALTRGEISAQVQRMPPAPTWRCAHCERQLLEIAGGNPTADQVGQRLERAIGRLSAARDRQQPAPVPGELAIVWRLDLLRVLADQADARALLRNSSA